MSWPKVVFGLVALYLAALSAEVGALTHFTGQERAQLELMTRLALEHAVKPSPSMPLFATACRGKLPTGEPQRLVGFTLAWDDATFVHMEQDVLSDDERLTLTTRDARALGAVVLAKDELDPTSWPRHVAKAARDAEDFQKAELLVVAKYGDLEPARVTANGVVPGSGTFAARVVRVPSGEVVCEGRGAAGMKKEIEGLGRGADVVHFAFKQGVLVTPLNAVCAAGGAVLCAETARWAGASF